VHDGQYENAGRYGNYLGTGQHPYAFSANSIGEQAARESWIYLDALQPVPHGSLG